MQQAFFVLILVACLGCGLVAGIFFAFSNFVMGALARLPAEHGIAAMQAINVTVLNPLFLGLFVGTALLSAAIAIGVLFGIGRGPGTALLAGSALYVFGCFAVTARCNVPRNEALARFAADDPGAHAYWRDYVASWTRWNHVRALASLGAAAAFAASLAG